MSTAISRGYWLSLGIGAALCGVAATGPRLFPVSPPGTAIEVRVAERAALSINDDATQRDLATRLEAVHNHWWSASRMDELKARVGPNWQLTTDAGEKSFRLVVLEAVDIPLTGWPALLDLVAELERESGLTIVGAEIRTTGSGAMRRFATVRLRLRVRMPL